MPTPLVARVEVVDMGGVTVMESAHPSYEAAWRQIHTDMEHKWALTRDSLPNEVLDAWADAFDEGMAIVRSALPDPGAVALTKDGQTMFTYYVTAYQPFGKEEDAQAA